MTLPKQYEVVDGGGCSTCNNQARTEDILKCHNCSSYFHAVCGTDTQATPFACKSFISSFITQTVKQGNKNFLFLCDHCLTSKEMETASDLKAQISVLSKTVNSLAGDFKEFKNQISVSISSKSDISNSNIETLDKSYSNVVKSTVNDVSASNVKTSSSASLTSKHTVNNTLATNDITLSSSDSPSDETPTKNFSSICVKSSGLPVDVKKICEIATQNGVQVRRHNVTEKGDVYVDLPSKEVSDKLSSLLQNTTNFKGSVVQLKKKLPSISILNVTNFESKTDFLNKIMLQNPVIKDMIGQGSEFNIVYSKAPLPGKSYFQVVARVSDDIRSSIRSAGNLLYHDLCALKVVDRFFVKRCNKCQRFGHYENECENNACCGYCKQSHSSKDCELKDNDSHKCINCERAGLEDNGHSSFSYQCPSYISEQNKVRKGIPYYNTSKNS